MNSPVRLVHTGNWRLDLPVQIPASPVAGFDPPDWLRELSAEAAFQSASRVVELALHQAVDAVLLSGNLLRLSSADPYSLTWLQQQLDRLDSQGIQVFWSGGKHDPPEEWPDGFSLPGCVHRFQGNAPEAAPLLRGGLSVAQVIGCVQRVGRRGKRPASQKAGKPSGPTPQSFIRLGGGKPLVGLFAGTWSQRQLKEADRNRLDLWALGGEGQPSGEPAGFLSAGSGGLITRCSRPQARWSPESYCFDTGGCWLVEVTPGGPTEATWHTTDSLQWQTIRLLVSREAQPELVAEDLIEHLGNFPENLPRGSSAGSPSTTPWLPDVIPDGPASNGSLANRSVHGRVVLLELAGVGAAAFGPWRARRTLMELLRQFCEDADPPVFLADVIPAVTPSAEPSEKETVLDSEQPFADQPQDSFADLCLDQLAQWGCSTDTPLAPESLAQRYQIPAKALGLSAGNGPSQPHTRRVASEAGWLLQEKFSGEAP